MANKNTRQTRNRLRKACRAGQISINVEVPVPNYHSRGDLNDYRAKPSSFFTNRSIPVCKADKKGLVSANPRRNTCERVYLNVNADGKFDSVTSHEPISTQRRITFKNHRYVENYKQPRAVDSQLVTA